jgi:4-amino-4-deoxy-L-arabinose transferase-like glycosyltransferase
VKRGQSRTLIGWIVVSLLAYGVLFYVLRPDLEPETWEPGEIAAHLLSGEGYSLHRFSGFVQPSANQEPAYTLLLAFFLAVFPRPYVFLTIFQVACWIACAALRGRLARRLIGAPQNWTALIVSPWPPLAIYVLTYHPLWLRSSALVLVIAAALFYKDEPRLSRAFLLGLALGFAALTRAPFLLLPVILFPWVAWSRRREKRPLRPKHATLCLAVAALVLSPWLIRNRLVLGAWITGTTTAGQMALIGNHTGASGALDGVSFRRVTAHLPPEFWHQSEVERHADFRMMVAEFWQTHTTEALVLYFKKLGYLWTWRPGVGSLYPRGWTIVYLVGWSLCLPLILVGWWLARNNSRAEAPNLFLALWIVFSFIYAFFAINMRYRFETEPLLVPYAIVAVQMAARRFQKSNGPS